MATLKAVNGPDSTDRLMVRYVVDSVRFGLPDPEQVGSLMYKTWLEMGSPANLTLVFATAINRAPAGYAHVWVGDGNLAWYVDPVTKQVPGGISPHDMRVEVYDAFAHRGVFVDTRNVRTLDDLARLIAHELRHLAGLGRTVETHPETEGPGWQRKLQVGLAQCAAAARKWRAD